MIYLDNAATTKPCEAAISAANDMMHRFWANPSSLYDLGMFSQQRVDEAREAVAKLIGAKEGNIVFVSGGTEANSIAIRTAVHNGRHVGKKIVASAYEHSSVHETLLALEKEGCEVTFVSPESDGTIDPEKVINACGDETVLVCVMLTNNELGGVNDIERIVKGVRERAKKAHIHSDAVAALGKMPINAVKLGVDTLSVSAHKIHALKGTGALYVKDRVNLRPLFIGGEQEKKLRPGTENAVGIAAFGAAAVIARENLSRNIENARKCHTRILNRAGELCYIKINAQNDFPFVTNLSVENVRSEILLHFLEGRGIYVSSGSACALGAKSHVLKALGLSQETADSAIRISLCGENTPDEIDKLFDEIINAKQTLKTRGKT